MQTMAVITKMEKSNLNIELLAAIILQYSVYSGQCISSNQATKLILIRPQYQATILIAIKQKYQ